MLIDHQAKQHILEHNKSKDLPYHNTRHMLEMTYLANLILLDGKGYVSRKTQSTLTVAGLFHDFNHSGGKEKDTVNIQRAVDGLHEFVEWCNHSQHHDLATLDVDVAEKAIRCTEFPFTRDPDCLIEEALRDADILYAMASKDPMVVMEGLRSEIEVSQQRNISYEEMLTAQVNFHDNIKFFTDYGRRHAKVLAPEYIKLLTEYVDLKTKNA